ncbi:MAG: rubrerythrin [Bacteroidetes bacterium HGW-Bacteroidetes-21]|jgi:rubrerythrin|nr:MAG: rubrerythrin [Bacteroidetes bacterium HGW-Bacteroidetes-21]
MKDFENINDILDFAIQNEQSAFEFYSNLSKNARNEDMKNTFEKFAQEEIGHKAKILKIKEEGIFNSEVQHVSDLKIADYLVKVDVTPDMSYQDALIIAMKREKSAFKLYTKLATKTGNSQLANLFLALAQEESKHKLMFEIEYDEFILREN